MQITSYFMELATPRTEEAIKLVDKVGDFEWLIQKYEADGASSIKLDLSLDTPIIIIPRHSSSKEYASFGKCLSCHLIILFLIFVLYGKPS